MDAALAWIAHAPAPRDDGKVRPAGRLAGIRLRWLEAPLLDSLHLRYLRKPSFPSQPTRKSSGE